MKCRNLLGNREARVAKTEAKKCGRSQEEGGGWVEGEVTGTVGRRVDEVRFVGDEKRFTRVGARSNSL